MEHIWSNTTNFLNHISNFLPWRGRESLTPLELARIVVSHLEMKYPNIFRSRDTVIYDAYCGWGTLLYACYEKLKEHHTDEYIFRNMLYGNEIEKFQYRILLEKLPDYGVTNITNHDSLKTEFPMKPTVIIFNPPYNTSGGANNIKDWNRHCQHQIEVNKPDYLVPIIPNQAVSNKGINGESLRNTLKMNGYGWIDAINHEESWFKANIDTCHAIWKKNSEDKINPILLNEKVEKSPILESIERKVTGVDKFLPLETMNEINRDLCNKKQQGQEILYSGDKIEWTTEPIEVDNQLKLVFPFSASYHKIFKTKLPTGMLNHYLPLSSEEEGESVREYCLSKLFRLVASSYKKSSGFTPFVKNKKIPDLRHKKDWTDEELYDYFNLTQEEIDFVNEH